MKQSSELDIEGKLMQGKKLANQISMYQFLLKRLFRENVVNIQKMKNQINTSASTAISGQLQRLQNKSFSTTLSTQKPKNQLHNKYIDSMQILNLGDEEFEQFVNNKNPSHVKENRQSNEPGAFNESQQTQTEQQIQELSDKFEEEIGKGENVNLNQLYNYFI